MSGLLAHTFFPDRSGAKEVRSWMVFLHGILGSRANWRGFAQRFVDESAGWGALLLDLRLHGDSKDVSFAAPHTLHAVSDDVRATLAALEIAPQAILGHSFGGKVALLCAQAQRRAGHVVDTCWSIDSPPGARPAGLGSESTLQVLQALRAIPRLFAARGDFVRALESRNIERSVAQWLAMNLRATSSGAYEFSLDLSGIEEMLEDFFDCDTWPATYSDQGAKQTILVVGGRSPVFTPQALHRAQQEALRDELELVVIPDAGHWVQVDQPRALLDVVRSRVHPG
jgi:pimeloyl-ACP methyl ester carboxylesterase